MNFRPRHKLIVSTGTITVLICCLLLFVTWRRPRMEATSGGLTVHRARIYPPGTGTIVELPVPVRIEEPDADIWERCLDWILDALP